MARAAVAEAGEPLAGIRALVLTVSDGVAAGVREDTGGAGVADRLAADGAVVTRRVVPDGAAEVAAALRAAATEGYRLLVATGGTGLGPRDRTPEGFRAALEMEVPGFGERMREAGRATTPMADLSRSLAGALGSMLAIAVPGSPRGAIESLEAVLPIVPHALAILDGRTTRHPGAPTA